MTMTDAELVELVKEGRKSAYGELVLRYEAIVRAVTIQVLGHNDDAREAAQEAFVKAYEKLPGLRNPNVFGPWLQKIARRCAIDIAKKLTREKSAGFVRDLRVSSDHSKAYDEGSTELLNAVSGLGLSEKQVVGLRYFSGLSVKDVAAVLGRSVSTVTKQLSRAHKRLRNVLGEKNDG